MGVDGPSALPSVELFSKSGGVPTIDPSGERLLPQDNAIPRGLSGKYRSLAAIYIVSLSLSLSLNLPSA